MAVRRTDEQTFSNGSLYPQGSVGERVNNARKSRKEI